MKAILALVCMLILWGCQTVPVTPGVHSTTTQEKNKEITVFERDGVEILKITKHQHKRPDRRMTRQEVLYSGQCVLHILDFQGHRTFSFKPGSTVEAGATIDENGKTTDVVLMSKDNVPEEWFKVLDGLLVPVPNEQLHRAQALTADVTELFDPKNMKRFTPDEFADQAVGIVEKHKKK